MEEVLQRNYQFTQLWKFREVYHRPYVRLVVFNCIYTILVPYDDDLHWNLQQVKYTFKLWTYYNFYEKYGRKP